MTKKTDLLEKAIEVALKAHAGQKDKAGEPYILHCLSVMLKGKTDDEKIVGVLHDIIEDTETNADDLREKGFPEEIINAVVCLTKVKGEKYDVYLERVKKNILAVRVKLNDLEDNMNLLRLEKVTEKDL
ncbi:MAG: HD domain-containing protein, partial [Ignavibacteria bacterium]